MGPNCQTKSKQNQIKIKTELVIDIGIIYQEFSIKNTVQSDYSHSNILASSELLESLLLEIKFFYY